jgi:GTP diphosphokinase / guanosine-3',5'-bis(diphosphate) 3'-diphosphatase
MNHITKFVEAIEFAAEKHKFQRRKGYLKIPYINHPVKVCKILVDCGESEINLLLAAILHDTIEDTDTTEEELIEHFGTEVTNLVFEVTDDMDLDENTRKHLQIINAPKLSTYASLIRIADKIANVNDILKYPLNWTNSRKLKYVDWATNVYNNCKGKNVQLDKTFEEICNEARKAIGR